MIRPLIFPVFTIILFLSGCATFQSPEPEITSIDQFPDFIVPDGQDIDTASVDFTLPDVDILALNEDMKRILDPVKAKGYRYRLDALEDFIGQNIRIDSIDDKYGTKTAIETFESGSGNCLSFSNLFVAMARYVGLKSDFQEIPTPPTWIKDGEVLLFTRHIGASVDIDMTPRYVADVIHDSGTIKAVYQSTYRMEYLYAPALPLSLHYYSLNRLSNRSISDRRAFAQYYNNIGSQHLVEGNIPDAFRYFVKAVKVDPDLGFVWCNLGVVYSLNNQPAAAENAYLQALSVNRSMDLTTMTIMSNLARLYTRQGKTEEANLYEEKVQSYRNMNPYYHYYIGEIAYYDGHYSESVEHYEDAIKRKPDDPQFHYALALAYFKLGEMGKAEKSMNKAISFAGDKLIEDYYTGVWKKLTEDAAITNELQ